MGKNENPCMRLTAPDYAKMIAITLVVIGHVLRGLFNADIVDNHGFWTQLDRGIYLFHMPLFFFISGLFLVKMFERYSLIKLMNRNFLILIVPLIFWSYLQVGLQYMAGDSVNNPMTLQDLVWAPYPPKFQFWFLSALFFISVFSLCIFKLKNGRAILGGLAIICAVMIGLADFYSIGSVGYKTSGTYLIGDAVFFFPYFVMGVFVRPQCTAPKLSGFIAYCAIFLGALIAYLYNYQEYNFYYYGFSIVSVFTLYKIIASTAKWVEKLISNSGNQLIISIQKSILFIGMNSMIIFLAHIIALAGARVILLYFGINDVLPHLIFGIGAGLFLPLGLVLVNVALSRYFPKLAQILIPIKFLKRQPHV